MPVNALHVLLPMAAMTAVAGPVLGQAVSPGTGPVVAGTIGAGTVVTVLLFLLKEERRINTALMDRLEKATEVLVKLLDERTETEREQARAQTETAAAVREFSSVVGALREQLWQLLHLPSRGGPRLPRPEREDGG